MRILIVIASLLLTSCAVTGDPEAQMRVWVSSDMSGRAVGRNPIATVLVSQPVLPYVEANFQHSSSLVEKDDPGQVNSIGIGFCVRFPIRECR